MDNNDREHPEEMDKLSKAIMEAILASDNVKKALASLISNNAKIDSGHMLLVMSLKGLSAHKRVHEDEEEDDDLDIDFSEEDIDFEPEIGYQIDGRRLSEREILFYEEEAHNFDEEGWLKKIKISLNND